MDHKDTVAYNKRTISTVAVGFVETVINGRNAQQASCRVEGADIRVRTDGANPTASEGLRVKDGEIVTVTGPADVAKFRAIRQGAVDATLFYQLEE